MVFRTSKETQMMTTTNGKVDWGKVSNLVCAILATIRENPGVYDLAAAERGIDIDQLTATAITEAIRKQFFSRK
jgi:hypothetical protein